MHFDELVTMSTRRTKDLKDLEEKIDRLEEENQGLKAALESKSELEAKIIDKLDQILSENHELKQRVLQLENQLSAHVLPPECPPTPSPPAAQQLPPENSYDVLLISDSICRHVGGEVPKAGRFQPAINKDIPGPSLAANHPPLRVKKIVIPGATCARLFSQAVELSLQYSFREVVCHVGANYVWGHVNTAEIANEISAFLDALKDLFSCGVTFSPILPRASADEMKFENRYAPLSAQTLKSLAEIDDINTQVGYFCRSANIDIMLIRSFIMDPYAPYPNKGQLAADGGHLNRKGVLRFEQALNDHLRLKFW